MTPYADMPAGAEMDRLVAEKVMGWRPAPGTYLNEHGDEFSCELWVWDGYKDDRDFAQEVKRWHPSTNIAHAWEVVERLCEGDSRWAFSLSRDGDNDYHAKFFGPVSLGVAAKAPLAICRAALVAVGK